MAGRPPLRIGQHGKISRKYLGNGVWEAQCRVRDTDGVTRGCDVSARRTNTTDTASSPRMRLWRRWCNGVHHQAHRIRSASTRL